MEILGEQRINTNNPNQMEVSATQLTNGKV